MLKETLSTLLTCGVLFTSFHSSAQEFRPQGVRVDFAYDFRPGKGLVEYIGGEDFGEEKIIMKQDIEEAVGEEKKNLISALSLGVGGEVKVAYTWGGKNLNSIDCFRNVPGYDFYIHEPNINRNLPETIRVFVSLNKNNSRGRWISFREKSVKDGFNGHIPYNLDDNLEGIVVEIGYSILVKDAESKLNSHGFYAGFEMSTAIIREPCRKLMASVN